MSPNICSEFHAIVTQKNLGDKVRGLEQYISGGGEHVMYLNGEFEISLLFMGVKDDDHVFAVTKPVKQQKANVRRRNQQSAKERGIRLERGSGLVACRTNS